MSDLAILGGEPTRTEPYPEWPVHDERDVEAVTNVVSAEDMIAARNPATISPLIPIGNNWLIASGSAPSGAISGNRA